MNHGKFIVYTRLPLVVKYNRIRKVYIQEGVGILPLPVPYFKAFALPTFRERATQKAHADMYYKPYVSG